MTCFCAVVSLSEGVARLAVMVDAISIQRQGEDPGRAVINVENSDRLIMYAADTVPIMTVVN